MIVLVTGANGQLGKSFKKIAFRYPDIHMHYLSRDLLDISDKTAVFDTCEEICPDYIINCAAYTAVDKAEVEQEKAQLINVTSVGYLAEVALSIGATLVHFSSDYVYHNNLTTPLKETDSTTPKGIYAVSKLDGENIIKIFGCKSIVIRTSWVYSEFGHNFVKTMLKLGKEKDTISIVSDQVGCPTYATDLAQATLQIILQYPFISDHQITLNFAGAGQVSWYEFAKEIFRIAQIDIKVSKITSREYPTPAKRPLWSVMDLNLLESSFTIKPRDWKIALKECLEIITKSN